MLPNLAFVPEQDVVDCFNILKADFPESALDFATYFEDTYIGKRLPIKVEGPHPFPSESGTCMKGYVNNYHELIM